jgi:hypothetical protein
MAFQRTPRVTERSSGDRKERVSALLIAPVQHEYGGLGADPPDHGAPVSPLNLEMGGYRGKGGRGEGFVIPTEPFSSLVRRSVRRTTPYRISHTVNYSPSRSPLSVTPARGPRRALPVRAQRVRRTLHPCHGRRCPCSMKMPLDVMANGRCRGSWEAPRIRTTLAHRSARSSRPARRGSSDCPDTLPCLRLRSTIIERTDG